LTPQWGEWLCILLLSVSQKKLLLLVAQKQQQQLLHFLYVWSLSLCFSLSLSFCVCLSLSRPLEGLALRLGQDQAHDARVHDEREWVTEHPEEMRGGVACEGQCVYDCKISIEHLNLTQEIIAVIGSFMAIGIAFIGIAIAVLGASNGVRISPILHLLAPSPPLACSLSLGPALAHSHPTHTSLALTLVC